MKWTRNAATTLCLLGLLLGCTAQRSEPDPEERIRAAGRTIVADFDLPGITIAVADPDGVRTTATGVADRERAVPMTPETTMLAASIGKTFVAATVLQLAEENRLGLDDPIARWLSDRGWFRQLPNSDTITIRHLLQHRSGLPDHVHLPAFAALWPEHSNRTTQEDLIALTFGTTPLFPAGTGWSHSDTGYLLLGLIIKAATGQCYKAMVHERFLEPLALTATGPANRKAPPALARAILPAEL